jgi:lysozyme family protein
MRSNYTYCLDRVLQYEGGWSDHPSDPGGATMKGVTLATYSSFLGRPATEAELRAIPDDHLQKIYRRDYWDKVKGDDLPGGVDLAVFDFAVNSGVSRASKYLQREVGTSQDGIIGPQTLSALAGRSPANVAANLCDSRLAFLKGLSTWPTFGKGWSNRVADVRSRSLKLADAVPPVPPPRPSDPIEPDPVPPAVAFDPAIHIERSAAADVLRQAADAVEGKGTAA